MSDDELRMCAYYYSFRETSVLAIDRVLSAVACAGKAYHHTDSWTDDPPEGYEDRRTEVQKIQDAANDAAKEVERLTRDRDSAREAVTVLVEALRPFAVKLMTTAYDSPAHEKARALVGKYGR